MLLWFRMQARQWSNRTIRQVVRTDWKVFGGDMNRVMNMMVTPKVVEEVRRHFNCPDLEGAELEDQGEEGTALTHWEKRIFEVSALPQSLAYQINSQGRKTVKYYDIITLVQLKLFVQRYSRILSSKSCK